VLLLLTAAAIIVRRRVLRQMNFHSTLHIRSVPHPRIAARAEIIEQCFQKSKGINAVHRRTWARHDWRLVRQTDGPPVHYH
jgi:hypothetical protein